MQKRTPTELDNDCEAFGLSIQARHVGCLNIAERYPQDLWDCKITRRGVSEHFEFKTGIGQRKCIPGAKVDGTFYMRPDGNRLTTEQAIKAEILRPVPPSVADVVACLVSEASAMSLTYDDWRDEFGSDDTLESLNTYIACQRSGIKLRKLLDVDQMATLRDSQH